jgi:hypothetical protein
MFIIDDIMPLVECDFRFGNAQVHCASRFGYKDVQTVIQTATNIILGSKDHLATIKVNAKLVQGILLPAAEHVPLHPVDVRWICPGMHHAIIDIMQDWPIAFVVGNGQWEIGGHFQFGTHHVSFHSEFPSHVFPEAMIKARDICGSLGFWDSESQGTLIEPLEQPYFYSQIELPSHYPNFYL